MLTKIIIENDNAPDTYVDISPIEGYGLYAKRKFAKNELVLNYNLFKESWFETTYSQLSETQKDRGSYVMIDNTKCLISKKVSKFRYVNHARTPNCHWDLEARKIYASKEIQQGEEILIDYRLEPKPALEARPDWV